MKQKIKVKPLSVNQCWRGRRYKTDLYKDYEQEVYYQLPELDVPEGKIELRLTFAFSSKNADYDNAIKPFQDILQKKYNFNDNRIYKAVVEKVDVKKGNEFISFLILPYENSVTN